MEPVVLRAAGIDIGKATLKATVRVQGGPRRGTRREVRSFGTTTGQLLALREWLVAEQVTLVGMESTGVFWKPVYYVLEDVVECWLLNAQHLKKVPGRKTDVSDSEWIAELVAHGLVRPSFVPPPGIRCLRDLTRYRTALTQDRTREIQRLQNVLEDAGIKLDCVATDITGTSARRILASLIAGERDSQVLAELALGRMRPKIADLQQALVGHFSNHHARLCAKMLAHIDDLTATIGELTAEIDTEIEPFRQLRKRLTTITGVSDRLAENLIAETGGDMNRFPTPQQLASWAGMCPGNNESAGKHFSGRTRKGSRWLRGSLGEAAAAASRSKGTYLSTRYRRLAGRRGKKRALVAIGHDILIAAWYIMRDQVDYHDLGPDYLDTHTMDPQRKATRLTQQLQALGYRVTLEHVA
ncbi:MAG TPA: IS110 family transposase [Jiangellaceae bacterium]|nr:IS110 family transposase [Jiangellaceae bacterium]